MCRWHARSSPLLHTNSHLAYSKHVATDLQPFLQVRASLPNFDRFEATFHQRLMLKSFLVLLIGVCRCTISVRIKEPTYFR